MAEPADILITHGHIFTLKGDGVGGLAPLVTSSPKGISCYYNDSECSSVFEVGTKITLTAHPPAWAIFAEWNGECKGSTNTACTFILKGNSKVKTFNV